MGRKISKSESDVTRNTIEVNYGANHFTVFSHRFLYTMLRFRTQLPNVLYCLEKSARYWGFQNMFSTWATCKAMKIQLILSWDCETCGTSKHKRIRAILCLIRDKTRVCQLYFNPAHVSFTWSCVRVDGERKIVVLISVKRKELLEEGEMKGKIL